jgi:hypothetical protein
MLHLLAPLNFPQEYLLSLLIELLTLNEVDGRIRKFWNSGINFSKKDV